MQKPLVPASLDEAIMEHIGSKLEKSEDQVEGEIDKFAKHLHKNNSHFIKSG